MTSWRASGWELLKEAVPTLTRAAILWEPAHVDNEFKGMQGAAPALGITLASLEVPRPRRADEVDRAIQTALDAAQALVLAPGGFTIRERKGIIDRATRSRLPVLSAWRIFAVDGALLTYGPAILEVSRRIAVYVDQVLRGAKPGDLPIDQPTTFELVINARTARALGLTIPPSLLLRADQVIE